MGSGGELIVGPPPILNLLDTRVADALWLAGCVAALAAISLLARLLASARASAFAWERPAMPDGRLARALRSFRSAPRSRRALAGWTAALVAGAAACCTVAPFTVRNHVREAQDRAVATLRQVASAQTQFRAGRTVDQDEDGTGEFGWLSELAGVRPPRGHDRSPIGGPFLPADLGAVDEEGAMRVGAHWYAMYLPGPDGAWRREPGVGPEPAHALPPEPTAAEHQERIWTCVAWPVGLYRHGCFAIDQRGEVLVHFWAGPPARPYCGRADGPPPLAARDESEHRALVKGRPIQDAEGAMWSRLPDR